MTIFCFEINLRESLYVFMLYINILWIIISVKNHFYEVYRHTRLIQIIHLLFRQIVLFSIIVYAFIGFFKLPIISRLALGNYLLSVFVLISVFKLLTTFLLKKYRTILRGNIRNVVVIGDNDKARQLIKIFDTRLYYGYKFRAKFNVKDKAFSLVKK